MNEKEIEYMIEGITKDLTLLLMERHGMDADTALRTIYNSDTYAKLEDVNTHLYYQSSLYIYDFLKNEIQTGKMQ
ncbi:hypothetical protein [Parabacteroides sp. AF17-28]|jgi:hypothetical protein|uniref:hypothetical protein n=1 Tax=Parabacteroides sp. AF17-28 TaxID=2292241 RepID=UPI000F008A92|nr:hypothetical protein [Parabacteroides sp. AF17-28]RHR62750.1 hypothetical protein DWW90_00540 [Parabacteroides sp. AF17-28]